MDPIRPSMAWNPLMERQAISMSPRLG